MHTSHRTAVSRPLHRLALVSISLLIGFATLASVSTTANAESSAEVKAQATYARQARDAGLSSQQALRLQNRVDERLDSMKVDAHQVGFNEIATDDGFAKITFPQPADDGDQLVCATDSPGYLCLYAGDYYDHEVISFYECAWALLADFGFQNRLTSYKNNQTDGTRAKFYTRDSDFNLIYEFDSVAPHKEPDLDRWNYGWNNEIDEVKVC